MWALAARTSQLAVTSAAKWGMPLLSAIGTHALSTSQSIAPGITTNQLTPQPHPMGALTHTMGVIHSKPSQASQAPHIYRYLSSSNDANRTAEAAAASQDSAASELHVTVEPLADRYEGVSVITLSRPAARNAIGRRLLRELAQAIDLLRQERTTRCVVLRSSVAGVFSAGADLKERATMTQAETIEFVTALRRTMSDMQVLPMPTIAAIDGFALGGGAELALATDIRVAGAGAVFAFPEAQLGIIPGAGGTQRLPRLLGASRAKELIFTGRRVKADEAVGLGLVDHFVEEGAAYKRALEIAAEVAKSAPMSLRMAKAAINHGLDVDLGTGLRMEEAYYAQLVPTKDRLEGLKAFAEKRPPAWKGE